MAILILETAAIDIRLILIFDGRSTKVSILDLDGSFFPDLFCLLNYFKYPLIISTRNNEVDNHYRARS